MSANDTYLAVFLGSKAGPRRTAWVAFPENDRRVMKREGRGQVAEIVYRAFLGPDATAQWLPPNG